MPGAWPQGWKGYLAKIAGLLVTAFALALGAPFWFDLLSKVARLRASGPPAPPSEQREADRPVPAHLALACASWTLGLRDYDGGAVTIG